MPDATLVVPVKAFRVAKGRLADTVSSEARAELARRMAERVVAAGAPRRVFVVCDDEGVRRWATSVGAESIWTPGLGLDGAVEAGVEHLASLGFDRAIVSHADLPLARSFDDLATGIGVSIVPDRHLDGSNVVSVPTTAGFRFHYGRASFEAHRAEARRLGLVTRLLRDAALGWDVDLPADLDHPDLADLKAIR